MRYEPQLGDRVTTVSLFQGIVEVIDGLVLTIVRDSGLPYLAHTTAVIRVKRDGVAYAVQRGRSTSFMLPMDTSFGQKEYMFYMSNRVVFSVRPAQLQ